MQNLSDKNKDFFFIKKKMNEAGFNQVESLNNKVNGKMKEELEKCLDDMIIKSKANHDKKKKNKYHVNVLFLQGHGVTYRTDSLLVVPDLENDEKVYFLNVTNLCKKFAKF